MQAPAGVVDPSKNLAPQGAQAVARTFQVSFCWNGKKTEYNGKLSVGCVDIKGLDKEISVSIPENGGERQRLNFRVFKEGTAMSSEVESLNITIDQLKRIKIAAGIFEPSPYQGQKVMDSRTGIITTQERVLRTDRALEFQLPREIVFTQSYTIMCSNREAKLVKSPVTFNEIFEKIKVLAINSKSDDEFSNGIGMYGADIVARSSFRDLEALIEESQSARFPGVDFVVQFACAQTLARSLSELKKQTETGLVAKLKELTPSGNFNFKGALDVCRGIEDVQKKAEAYHTLITSFFKHKDYSLETALNVLQEMPDGDLKTGLTEILNVEEKNSESEEEYFEEKSDHSEPVPQSAAAPAPVVPPPVKAAPKQPKDDSSCLIS